MSKGRSVRKGRLWGIERIEAGVDTLGGWPDNPRKRGTKIERYRAMLKRIGIDPAQDRPGPIKRIKP